MKLYSQILKLWRVFTGEPLKNSGWGLRNRPDYIDYDFQQTVRIRVGQYRPESTECLTDKVTTLAEELNQSWKAITG